MVNLNNSGNVIMTQAPNLDFVPNVEMPNAPNLVRPNTVRPNTVRPNTVRQLRARAEFHARMANQEAKIRAEEKAREKAIKNAAKKAEENARQEAVNRSKAEATAAKAAARAKREKSNRNIAAAKKAAENAEKAKKLAANAIVKNVDNKLKVIKNGPGSKENKNKLGTKVYRKASLKLHPQRPGGSEESFKKLGSIYSNFQTKIGTKVRVEQELSNENRPR